MHSSLVATRDGLICATLEKAFRTQPRLGDWQSAGR
jgi:hypothetical protein